MSSDKELKLEFQRVKTGKVRNFGFLKGLQGNPHGLLVTRKRIAGPLVRELQEKCGNKAKPIVGQVRFDALAKLVIFETRSQPGPLRNHLREIIRKRKIPVGKFEVRRLEAPSEQEGQPILEALIQDPSASTSPQPAILFTHARLAWDAARKDTHSQIEKLKQAIRVTYRDQANYEDVVAALQNLDKILTALDTRLLDKLDEALNAPDPAGRQQRLQEAQGLLAEYQQFLTSDPLALRIDNNPFVPLTVQQKLLATVNLLASKLKP